MAPDGFPPERSARMAPGLDLRLEPGRVIGAWRMPARTVAIVLDGTIQAILPADSAGFVWPVPPHLFGRLLDVQSVPEGGSLLAAPVDLSAVRKVSWGGWTVAGDWIGGDFTAEGTAPMLPVALMSGDVPHAQGFARQQGERYVFALRLNRLAADGGGLALQPVVGGLVLPPVLHLPADALAHVGFIDVAEPWRARGWAVERAHPTRRVTLELYIDGAFVRNFVADRARDDVAAFGFGDGFAGFDVAINSPLDRAVLIDVRIAGGPSLGNSPICARRPRASSAGSTGWTGSPPADGSSTWPSPASPSRFRPCATARSWGPGRRICIEAMSSKPGCRSGNAASTSCWIDRPANWSGARSCSRSLARG